MLENMSPETSARATEIAKQRLAKVAKGGRDWTFDSFYMPYTLGDVIRVNYKDSDAHAGFDFNGMVTDIEYTLAPGGLRMRTTARGLKWN